MLLLALLACGSPPEPPAPTPTPTATPTPAPRTLADQAEPAVMAPGTRTNAVYLRVAKGGSNQLTTLDDTGWSCDGTDVDDLYRAADGTVWALGDGVWRLGSPDRISLDGAPEGPDALAVDARGRVWVAGRTAIGRWDGESWVNVDYDTLVEGRVFVKDVLVDGAGTLWLSLSEGLFRHDTAWSPVPLPKGRIDTTPGDLARAADGTVWVGAITGTLSQDGDGWTRVNEVDTSHGLDLHGAHRIEAHSRGVSLAGPDGSARSKPPEGVQRLIHASVDTTGRAWLTSDAGLHVRAGDEVTFPVTSDRCLDGELAQIVASGAGPTTLPAPAPPRSVAVTATFTRGEAPLAGATVVLCPFPELFYRGDDPCSTSAHHVSAKTDANGVLTWPAVTATTLRLAFEVDGQWKSTLGGDWRCCEGITEDRVDLGTIDLPQ
jgi:hypothetical protein